MEEVKMGDLCAKAVPLCSRQQPNHRQHHWQVKKHELLCHQHRHRAAH
jgi:hypothetical protein